MDHGQKVALGPLSQGTWPVVINDFSCLRNTRLDIFLEGFRGIVTTRVAGKFKLIIEGTALSIAGDEFWEGPHWVWPRKLYYGLAWYIFCTIPQVLCPSVHEVVSKGFLLLTLQMPSPLAHFALLHTSIFALVAWKLGDGILAETVPLRRGRTVGVQVGIIARQCRPRLMDLHTVPEWNKESQTGNRRCPDSRVDVSWLIVWMIDWLIVYKSEI